MERQRILLIGLGKLGAQIFDLLVRLPGSHLFLAYGRDQESLRQRSNLSLLAAIQLGHNPEVRYGPIDLWKGEQTAETLAHLRPDLIISTATLSQWGRIPTLPQALAERLAAAQMGPRLPFYLTLTYKLMQALQATGRNIPVLNAVYPDVVNPVLGPLGLAPLTGIGELANNVPALRRAVALKLNVSLAFVEVRLVMARYVSYWLSRRSVRDTPFSVSVIVNGQDITQQLETEELFAQVPTTLKRTGGDVGLLMTATSAVSMIEGMLNGTKLFTHAPGPQGLPGGYPIHVGPQGIELALPQHLSLDEALQINQAGLRLDGIEQIASDGTVSFAQENMAIFKEVLGYECRQMRLSEVEEWAQELRERYAILAQRYH